MQLKTTGAPAPGLNCQKSLSLLARLLSPVAVCVLVLAAFSASAQQLYIQSGITKDSGRQDDTFAWVADYSEPLSKHFAYSLVYVNEGHFPDHHRDGVGAQLWIGGDLTQRWSIKLGVGPYLYFDTARKLTPAGYADDHGVGVIASLATTWQFGKHWGMQLRANRILTKSSIDTTSLVLGLGYQFDAAVLPSSQAGWAPAARRNEITAYVGRTYVNNFHSETAFAQNIEYRRTLAPHFDWTLAVMNEGDPGPLKRFGLMSELWFTRNVLRDRMTLGFGIGPYWSVDRRDNDRSRLAGILSITAAYHLSSAWMARLTWHRVATDHDLDTDVFLLGAGYRW